MRAKEIDGMKGALIFFVVLGHFLLPLLGFGARSINLPFDLIYSFHMPAFVFLSGLFAGHALRSPRHWCKRCLTLLWLYLCFKWLVFYPERAAYQTGGTWPDFWHDCLCALLLRRRLSRGKTLLRMGKEGRIPAVGAPICRCGPCPLFCLP